MAILEAVKIHKSYGNKFNRQEVLKGLDISIEKGEFVGIMGASGSGKTTLLNVLSSIDKVSGGSIIIEGTEMTGMKEKQLAEFRKNHLGFTLASRWLSACCTAILLSNPAGSSSAPNSGRR
jgi:bacitracin transport system ATP-binding protein